MKEVTVVEVAALEDQPAWSPSLKPSDLIGAFDRIVERDLKSQWIETGHPPLIIVDFCGSAPSIQQFHFALLTLHKFVSHRNGRICCCGSDLGNVDASPLVDVARDLDDAVAALLPFRQELVRDADALSNVDSRLLADVQFCLIGCPDRDYGELPGRFVASGLSIRNDDTVVDNDFVLFCISCFDGPTSGTKQAVAKCSSRTITPLAIVLTSYVLVDDDSLRDLITMEEFELLSRVLPHEVIDSLPVLCDFDPGLVSKIVSRIANSPQSITCKMANEK